jgi:hypothetical protein
MILVIWRRALRPRWKRQKTQLTIVRNKFSYRA